MGIIDKIFGTYSQREIKRLMPTVNKVMSLEEAFKAKSDAELQGMTQEFRQRLANGETMDSILPEAFAVCREAADRVLGMRPFMVQVLGGLILHQGRIAEMKTGEGKTLVATMPVYLNALTGKGVHVVTVNDYLAKTNCEQMGKIYSWLGLSCGVNLAGLPLEEKRRVYRSDIVYGTNNEYGFDYLRDNMATSEDMLIQRQLAYAIVDEVDSILIDEARTPLIISGPGDKPSDMYGKVDKFVLTLSALRVKEVDSKEEQDDVEADYIVDEKAKTAVLTPRGTQKAEKHFGVENWNDPGNLELVHYVNQSVKAHGIMHRDIDYLVKDNEIVIIDEFTGRLMIGRRFSEGLHQAIEAKEGVEIRKESKTYATITFQNFFRMYDKLSGMTGTAMTEEDEFRQIYGLDVIEVPTNRPVIRNDRNDKVFKTQRGKYTRVIEAIVEKHKQGQPVLVGTVSVEKSELVSKMLKARGVPHNVLNAKHHEKEAEIIAQAGKKGAVTISTNMAGRGTDIMLGGNADFLAKSDLEREGYTPEQIMNATSFFATDDEEIIASRAHYAELVDKHRKRIAPEAEEVKALGGLFVLGTERHEARRIDYQLRGRSGRQGDPGESCFYLSLEDDLMRLFGGERAQMLIDKLGVEDDEEISAGMLSSIIEGAQKKIEARNFESRKHVLQYDDVMNKQREIIYAQRSRVLRGEDVHSNIENMLNEYITATVNKFTADEETKENWNIVGLRDVFLGWLLVEGDMQYTEEELEALKREDLCELLKTRADERLKEKEAIVGADGMRQIERMILLRTVDNYWISHIDNMEQLKRGIGLRSLAQHNPVVEYRVEGFDMFDDMVETVDNYWISHIDNMEQLKRGIGLRSLAQHNPVVEYRVEGFDMFDDMVDSIKEDTVRGLITVVPRIVVQAPERRMDGLVMSGGATEKPIKEKPYREMKKISPNDLCPCGSGKKYKKCCGQ